jgi:hypothetical protein
LRKFHPLDAAQAAHFTSPLLKIANLATSCPPALALRSPANRRGTRTCVFANRENVGRVDHPEHHAQARPKWNGGYKLIVRLGATANEKERSCPRFSLVDFWR